MGQLEGRYIRLLFLSGPRNTGLRLSICLKILGSLSVPIASSKTTEWHGQGSVFTSSFKLWLPTSNRSYVTLVQLTARIINVKIVMCVNKKRKMFLCFHDCRTRKNWGCYFTIRWPWNRNHMSILLDVLVGIVAEYLYELYRIFTYPQGES